MSDNILFSCSVGVALVAGFFIGKIQPVSNELESFVPLETYTEISIIQLNEIQGDEVLVSISGPARLLWGDGNMVENDGEYSIPLGQIPHETDIELQSFPYIGNAKTMKFYPSDSYFARGTEVRYRRFFASKKAATDAGFIPIKNMK